MKSPVDRIFPPVEIGKVPFPRLVLRGISQMCFQTNELTGLFFLAAVLVVSPLSFMYLLLGAILGPIFRRLIGERKEVLSSGLPGLNPSLIALSLPVFFQTGWTNIEMWAVLIVCIFLTVLLVKLCVTILPFPTLALPFILIFWILNSLSPHFSFIQPVVFDIAGHSTFHPVKAVLLSLGQALFSPNMLSGLLFLAGVAISNWRHGIIALLGAIIGTMVAYYYREVDPSGVNLGLYGFNGVLTAVSVFVVCGGKLRLSILGTLIATMMMPLIAHFGVQILSAPFVFTTWVIITLGWLGKKWLDAPLAESSE